MTPTAEIPTGVTVDGRPLEIVLQEMEDTRKKKEIRENYKGEILGKVCYAKGTYPYHKYREVKEPNGKVRRLTMSQIKKEYGKMRNPSLMERVINSLKNDTWQDLPEVAKDIGGDKGSTSAALSTLLKEKMIEAKFRAEKKHGKSWRVYAIAESYREWDTPAIYGLLKQRKNDQCKSRREKKKSTSTTFSEGINSVMQPQEVLQKILQESLEKMFKVKVEISGSVQIKFSFATNAED